MSKVSSNPPSGFRDFLPHEAAARLDLVETITRVYRCSGFQPIGMPMLENLATLQGKGGGADNEKLIFKVMNRGDALKRALLKLFEEKRAPDAALGKSEDQTENFDATSGLQLDALADLGLRFDLTLPLARYCARFREQLPKPFKVFQIGPVWRADRPQKGRFREFYQCDVDIIGSKEIGAEIECISAILRVFDAVGMKGVEVHLNDRRMLSALKDENLSAEQWASALVTLDKLDKIDREGVEKELTEKLGAVPAGIKLVLEGEDSLSAFAAKSPESAASLGAIVELLSAGTASKVIFNPTLVRGQDYYTGTIFEIRHANLSGSLGGGGRYNRLLEVFGSPETPAFGGSIGFERLGMLLQEQHHAGPKRNGSPQFFFPLFGEEMRGPVLKLAALLRAAGLSVDVFPDANTKFGKQLAYADNRQIPYALILGGNEAAANQIKLKDMAAKTEKVFSTTSPSKFAEEMEALCKPITP